jgi:hypothetical protein
MDTDQLPALLRDIDDAIASLTRVVAGLKLERPSVYHDTLISLTSKRGVLESHARRQRDAVAEAERVAV